MDIYSNFKEIRMKFSRFTLTAGLFLMVVGVSNISQASEFSDDLLLENLQYYPFPRDIEPATLEEWARTFTTTFGNYGKFNENVDMQEKDNLMIRGFFRNVAKESPNIKILREALTQLSPRVQYAFATVLKNNINNMPGNYKKLPQQIVQMVNQAIKDLKQKYGRRKSISTSY